MNKQILKTACAMAACAALGNAYGQAAAAPAPASAASAAAANAQTVVVTTKRDNRVSKGATGLEMSLKDTPQTISTIAAEDMKDFGTTGSNDALRLGTGINVEQYETNRATFNSRGFDVQLTQLDGVGMANSWGTVVGQQDTFLFDKIELIRGANGLLTGVGNASGTINYVRKRPTNRDGGEIDLAGGSWNNVRGAIDYNKLLTADGSWAARVIATHDDGDSYLRALHNKKTNLYGVVDGQIGEHGTLTLGASYQDARQKDPMWGALTFTTVSGKQASYDVSASTTQDWTYWNVKTRTAFAEYTHDLGRGWEAKLTYNHQDTDQHTKIFYAYNADTGLINDDGTGLIGDPYRSHDVTHSDMFDASLSGKFDAFGRRHELMVGASRSRASTDTATYAVPDAENGNALPAFPYAGDVYPEPDWGPAERTGSGHQTLTRGYGVTRIAVTDALKAILGVNAVKLHRVGSSIYGSGGNVTKPNSQKVSPYAGLTYAITPAATVYASYSDILQNQDQSDANGDVLAPAKGVNVEAGVKAEWLNRKLLTTFALFQARERGLATYGGIIDGNYWYYAEDKKSQGFEAEVTGHLSDDAKVTLGFTHLALLGNDGHSTDFWVPRNTANFRFDTRLAALPSVRVGVDGHWQSAVTYGTHQGAYVLANGFAAWEVTPKATLRLNVDNLLNKKYITGVENGGFYGAPTNGTVALEYKL